MRTYRALLMLYPRSFRALYGDDMATLFAEQQRELVGPAARIRLWAEATVDAVLHGLLLRVDSAGGIARGTRLARPDGRGPTVLRGGGNDVRRAVRALIRRPAATGLLVATLALGIGAATTVFSVASGVFSAGHGLDDPGRVIAIDGYWPTIDERGPVPVGDVFDYQESSRAFEIFGVANAWYPRTVSDGTDAFEVRVRRASPDYFRALGITPILGAGFPMEISEESCVVLMSEGLWRSRFGADSEIVGESLRLRGVECTVTAVMPATADLGLPAEGPGGAVDLWEPYGITPSSRNSQPQAWRLTIGRLHDDVALAEAQAEMDLIAARQREEFEFHAQMRQEIVLTPLTDQIVGPARSVILLTSVGAAFILLVSCINAAILLQVEGGRRRPEWAIQLALGCPRRRIRRQVLLEMLMACCAAAALAYGLARLGAAQVQSTAAGRIARANAIEVDLLALAFCVAMALVVALFAGWIPAARASSSRALASLRSGARTVSEARSGGGLIVAEVMLTVPLLVGAGLLAGTMLELQRLDLGFRPESVLTFDLRTPRGPGDRYRNEWFLTLSAIRDAGNATSSSAPLSTVVGPRPRGTGAIYQEIEERLGQLPGVEAVGHGSSRFGGRITASAAPDPEVAPVELDARFVSPGHFESMGTPLLGGRTFGSEERTGVVVLDRRAADSLGEGGSVLGDTLIVSLFGVPFPARVVGVVETALASHETGETLGALFLPSAGYALDGAAFNVRLRSASPESVQSAIKGAVRAVEADMAPMNVSTLQALVSGTRARQRTALILIAAFGGTALAISLVGLYASLAAAVHARRGEIGIRMALGATGHAVRRQFLLHGLRQVAAGSAAGLLLAGLTSGILGSLVYGLSPLDPRVYGAVVVLVFGVAMAACWLPAVRAAQAPPGAILDRA